MIHSLLLALGILAVCAYGLAVCVLVRSWHRATGLRARLARWLGRDQDPVESTGRWASLVRWAQVAVAIVVMPLAALVLVATILVVSGGMVLLSLTIAVVCGCAFLLARAAAQRTSAPGL
jgi:hypothetical protein